MSDVVVTVPAWFWLKWIDEGDPAGAPWSGTEWAFSMSNKVPAIDPGERVYIVCRDRLRGYAPLVRIDRSPLGRISLIRAGGAVAVTVADLIPGFRGYRYRWWNRDRERPFPDWRKP